MASNTDAGLPKLFNELYCSDTSGVGRRFLLFPSLPTELRLKIWACILEQTRMIDITIQAVGVEDDEGEDVPDDIGDEATDEAGDDEAADEGDDAGDDLSSDVVDREMPVPDSLYYSEKNQLGNVKSGKNYFLSLSSQHQTSPLLQVNSEARMAALSFYRVHLPCSQEAAGPCLYFNPHFDFLHIQIGEGDGDSSSIPELLTDVLHDCKAYDPLGHGVLNLVVGDGDAASFSLPLEPQLVAPQSLEAFKSTLMNLETLFFYHRATSQARLLTSEWSTDRIRYNRGVPLESPAECFSLAGADPRPIKDDLRLTCVGVDPRASLWLWQEMERKFGIVRPDGKKLDSRFLLTSQRLNPTPPGIVTCPDARQYLEHEERFWNRLFTEGLFRSIPNPDSPEQVKTAQPAFGFWLLDLDAFGEMPEQAGPFGFGMPYEWSMKMDVELNETKHWPQLGVFHLACE